MLFLSNIWLQGTMISNQYKFWPHNGGQNQAISLTQPRHGYAINKCAFHGVILETVVLVCNLDNINSFIWRSTRVATDPGNQEISIKANKMTLYSFYIWSWSPDIDNRYSICILLIVYWFLRLLCFEIEYICWLEFGWFTVNICVELWKTTLYKGPVK